MILKIMFMKTSRFLLALPVAAVLLLISSSVMYPSGAPAAKTGSPGDGANCSECHGSSATTTTGLITSNIPADGYVAGQTYQITATNSMTGSGKYGFEVSPQNATGTQLGTLVAGTGSKLVGGTKYVTQSSANSTTHVWTFGWVAPVAGTGAVTFYGAFARNYTGATTLSTLTVQEAAVSLPAAAGPITGPVNVCLNSTQNYSVGSIAGATSYVWTAPAGATLAAGQGTPSVSVSFGASAVSGNISVYGANAAGNGEASNKSVTVNSAPVTTSIISGNYAPCQLSSQTYTLVNTPGVTYTWTVPTGSVITSGQGTNSVAVTIGVNSGALSVAPSNDCGNGPTSSTTLVVQPLPATPAIPDGPSLVNVQNTLTSDYTTSAGYDSYIWQLTPVTAGTISGTTALAQVTWNSGFIGYAEIKAKVNTSCGESAWSPVKITQVLNTTGTIVDASDIKVITGADGNITLEMNTSVKMATVMLVDMSGNALLNTSVPGKGTHQLLRNLKPGVYIIFVDAGTNTLKKKILVI
jgi:hypothetical protein